MYHMFSRKKEESVHRTGVKILEARIGIESTAKELLPTFPLKVEVPSLLTDFKSVEEIPYSKDLDGYITVEDADSKPSFEYSGDQSRFLGPFRKLAKEASDQRYSLWGNQGFLYRYSLYLLEKKHRIFNLHACALYSEKNDHLYVISGGAGSGKTVYLLSGLLKGLKLYSTETVHVRIEKNTLSWYMGSLVDNVRLGTLTHHFPLFSRQIDAQEVKDEWQRKIALDLSSYKTDFEKLSDPKSVTILFPRIEDGREGFLLTPILEKKQAAKALFDNITQKLSETWILYDRIPVSGIDEEELAHARFSHISQLVQHESIIQTAAVLSNPQECWGDLLEKKEKKNE